MLSSGYRIVSLPIILFACHDDKIITAIGVFYVAIGAIIIHPFAISPVAELVFAVQFQVNGDAP